MTLLGRCGFPVNMDQVTFDSDSILKMGRIPTSLAVIGGGVIGCEYASIFTALGVQVGHCGGAVRAGTGAA